MKVLVPVVVKMIITDKSRAKIIDEFKASIQQLKLELEQLQFQHKKLLNAAQKKGGEAVKLVQEKISVEKLKREEKIDKLFVQLDQLDKLEDGKEILHSTLETEVEINVNDPWDDLNHLKEIIVKDGIIIEIRKGSPLF